MTAAILILAVALDSLTFAFVIYPAGGEANPAVLLLGAPLALSIRWAGVLLLLAVRRYLRSPRRWLLAGAASGVVGAASNALAMWRAV
jgi:hypothetical protein